MKTKKRKYKIHPSLTDISEAIRQLREDDVIRTNNLVGDLGEYYACSELTLTRLPKSNKGHDALDTKNRKVEIKTRRTPQPSGKIAFRYLDFDYCIYIELNHSFEPIEIRKATLKTIESHFEPGKQRLSVKKFKSISEDA